MKRYILLFILFILAGGKSFAQTKHSFEIKDGNFLYDGKPTHIYSGEMHYARVPDAYWRHRLQMIKAMGLNTVCSYVFWNYHETAPGKWDFKTGNRNIRKFLQLAAEEGLMVILRPGPYACAEWDFGGYPWWLGNDKNIVIRSYEKSFLDSCKIYLDKLAAEIKDMLVSNGGPVIMIQAENEFGSYVSQREDISLEDHKKYSAAIKQLLVNAGFNIPLFTSDATSLFKGGTVDGALPMGNGENDVDNLKRSVDEYHHGIGPYMVAEYYPGWLDHWGEPFQKVETKDVIEQVEKYLKNEVSFNFYMVHGGTNFGFTSGANYNNEHDLQPDITSYDYDAPINEAGWPTGKYHELRSLLMRFVPYTVPEVPATLPLNRIEAIKLDKVVDLFSLANKANVVTAVNPKTFEDLHQGFGYVLYSKHFGQSAKGKLSIKGLRDYAIVYVNKKQVAILDRRKNTYDCDIDIPANGTLDILVENMGRINYGSQVVNNLKGIISPVLLDDKVLVGEWTMRKFPMDKEPDLDGYNNSYVRKHPIIYTGSFNVNETADTFLDMSDWGKGIVFVNGHNLGRYWNIGPQQTLYLPGCWLNKGMNSICIFEQLNEKEQHSIGSVERPVLDLLRK